MTDKIITTLNAPRDGTKQAKLVAMLSRKNGVTLEKASADFGWQKHTTRAALTGLRKRGYKIENKTRENKPSLYRIIKSDTDVET